MAISFTSIEHHSRTKGHSAVAAAAYRSGVKLNDKRTGLNHSYQNKKQIIHSEILLPEGASDKYKDREYLWNKVEEAEKKINARVCRDIVIALPKEMEEQDWIELSRRFAQEHFVSKGLVADISIHDNEGNPHCHILLSTRRLIGLEFDTKKARDLEGEVRKSSYGIFSSSNNIYQDDWRSLQNDYFKEKNIDLVVDQNYLISQLHEGKVSSDEISFIRQENQIRKEQSVIIANSNPDFILSYLTQKNTVFSIKDIESIAYKNSNTKEEYNNIINSIISNKSVVKLGYGLDGREHYTTKYAMEIEHSIISDIHYLTNSKQHKVNDKYAYDNLKNSNLSKEQFSSVRHLIKPNDISVVIGKPGTGKSYMLNNAKEIWEKSGYKIHGVALSGIASFNLKESANINSKTLQSFLYCIENNYIKMTNKDILVVDEAGMLDTFQMSKLLKYTRNSGAKIVLIGDPDQLQPIGPGEPLRAITETIGYVEMVNIRRQELEWQREATQLLAKGDSKGLDLYYSQNRIDLSKSKDEVIQKVINDWNKETRPDNLLESVIIAHRNIDVNIINEAARIALFKRGILSNKSIKYKTHYGDLNICLGEKILFTENNKTFGIKNGMFGIVKEIDAENNRITVSIATDKTSKTISLTSDEYNKISYGYASTVHKLQGATVDRSYIYLGGKHWNKNLILVALSRHKKDIKIYGDKETYRNYDDVKKSVLRENFNDSVLNYPVSFSMRRGFDPDSIIGRACDKLKSYTDIITDKWLWLVNKQGYLERQEKRVKEKIFNENISKAKVIAKLKDLELELYKNKDRNSISAYKLQNTINKIGSHIYKNYKKYEIVCNYNNITLGDLKRYNNYNTARLLSREYIKSYIDIDNDNLKTLSSQMKDNLSLNIYHLKNNINEQPEFIKSNIIRSVYWNSALNKYDEAIKTNPTINIDNAKLIKSFADKINTYRTFWQNKYICKNTDIKLSFTEKKYLNNLKFEINAEAIEIESKIESKDLVNYLNILNINYSTFNKYKNINWRDNRLSYSRNELEKISQNPAQFDWKKNSAALILGNSDFANKMKNYIDWQGASEEVAKVGPSQIEKNKENLDWGKVSVVLAVRYPDLIGKYKDKMDWASVYKSRSRVQESILNMYNNEIAKTINFIELNKSENELLSGYLKVKFNRENLLSKVENKSSIDRDLYSSMINKLEVKGNVQVKNIMVDRKLINKLEAYAASHGSPQAGLDINKAIQSLEQNKLTKSQAVGIVKEIHNDFSRMQRDLQKDMSKGIEL